MKYPFFLLVLLSTTTLPSMREAHTPINKHSIRTEDKPDPVPQIMAASFFNALIHGFIAAHSQDDKEKRINAVSNALASLSAVVQLAFKSLPETRSMSREQVVDLICEKLMDHNFVDEVVMVLTKKGHYLKMVK